MTAKQRHRVEVFTRDPLCCALANQVEHRCTGDDSPFQGTRSFDAYSLQSDHIIEVAHLKELHERRRFRDGVGLAEDFEQMVADGRNGWILCETAHALKTRGLIVIAREFLPPCLFDFIDDYDCAHLLEGRACFA